jgi:hypothetical protein
MHWLVLNGRGFSRAEKSSVSKPALAAEGMQLIEQHPAGAKQAAEKGLG